ncbi:MAG: hypothetical protein RI988_2784 [Pseudomonadota bacterium]
MTRRRPPVATTLALGAAVFATSVSAWAAPPEGEAAAGPRSAGPRTALAQTGSPRAAQGDPQRPGSAKVARPKGPQPPTPKVVKGQAPSGAKPAKPAKAAKPTPAAKPGSSGVAVNFGKSGMTDRATGPKAPGTPRKASATGAEKAGATKKPGGPDRLDRPGKAGAQASQSGPRTQPARQVSLPAKGGARILTTSVGTGGVNRSRNNRRVLMLASAAGAAVPVVEALAAVRERAPAAPEPDAPLVLSPSAGRPESASEPDDPGNLLLMDVVVDRMMVASAMTAYQIGKGVFVPMGELARMLTLSVRADPARRRASGFLLSQERSFDLDVAEARVVISGRVEKVDTSAVRVLEDDIYIDTTLLENWWPVRLRPDRSRLVLEVQPREALPLQLRLARERAASMIGRGGGPRVPDLPRQEIPYRPWSWPAIDQTLTFTAGRSSTDRSASLTSTSYLTGDLFGLEASAYANVDAAMATGAGVPATRDARLRMALGRSDPQGKALGPVPATSFSVGNVLMPGVNHVFRTSTAGPGFTVSNLPLERGTNFSSTSFQGALPPGWDVELFFNDALVGYQQSRPDGTYAFSDVPLIFGENRFRLVFHGPQGQTRVETRTYNLDASTVRPGEFLYSVGAHRDAAGVGRGLVQLEYGVDTRLAAYGGLVAAPPQPGLSGRQLANGGLRAFLDGWLVYSDLVHCLGCSTASNLYSLGMNTRVSYGTISASHALLDNFSSELYPASPDPIRSSSRGRLDAMLPVEDGRPVPVTAQLQVDNRRSGASDVFLTARATHAWNGSTVTHELSAQSVAGQQAVLGGLQLSRQLAGMSFRGQMLYKLEPDTRVDTGLLSADWSLSSGHLLNVSAIHKFQARDTSLSLTLNRNFGAYSLRAGLSRSTSGSTTAGLQFFTSTGRDPGAERWRFGALPGANSGAASARVFLDRNLNSVFDDGDEPVQGASFFVNGTASPARTDASGVAFIQRLTPYRDAGITLNPSSLEDSQWSPGVPGFMISPRPGTVASLQFPVVVTAEIDGYVQLEGKGGSRGVSDVQLELYDSAGKLQSRVRSTADGYFLISNLKPGRYTLTVAEEQVRRLGLEPVQPLQVEVAPDGQVANGYDFVLRKIAAR